MRTITVAAALAASAPTNPGGHTRYTRHGNQRARNMLTPENEKQRRRTSRRLG